MKNQNRLSPLRALLFLILLSIPGFINAQQYMRTNLHVIDGKNLVDLHNIQATNTGNNFYTFSHPDATTTDNYYRIKAVQIAGNVDFTHISKVSGINTAVGVYPNPVANKSFNIKMEDKEVGVYNFFLVSMSGIVYKLKPVNFTIGLSSQKVEVPVNVFSGLYQLIIIKPGNQQQVIRVRIL